jgi:nicotinamide-nucleotide amidase
VNFDAVEPLVAALGCALRQRRWKLAAAESCTGGLLAAACTSIAGSSDWFDRGYVTYSNQAKVDALGVDPALVAAHGAVSEPVARAMARGALERSHADLALAVTGIAGPGGAVAGKPVGTVWLALALRAPAGPSVQAQLFRFDGDRSAVRAATVREALARALAITRQPV